MVRVNFIGPDEQSYPDPSICCYLTYPCSYCTNNFQPVEPDNKFMAGGTIVKEIYRNKLTGEVIAGNKVMGVCRACSIDMVRRQQSDS